MRKKNNFTGSTSVSKEIECTKGGHSAEVEGSSSVWKSAGLVSALAVSMGNTLKPTLLLVGTVFDSQAAISA